MNHEALNIHQELIDRCRHGDREAHYQLYKRYSRAMYNAAYRIVGNSADAEDALQEAFISAFKNLDSYRGDATFGSWLKRIVVNKAINTVKRKRMELLPDDDHFDVAEPEEAEAYRSDLTVEKVRKAIEALPVGYRTVLSLYLLEGYDHQEIAEIMGISESTSKSQLNRARKKLQEYLT